MNKNIQDTLISEESKKTIIIIIIITEFEKCE
jgi:hypothetical protein